MLVVRCYIHVRWSCFGEFWTKIYIPALGQNVINPIQVIYKFFVVSRFWTKCFLSSVRLHLLETGGWTDGGDSGLSHIQQVVPGDNNKPSLDLSISNKSVKQHLTRRLWFRRQQISKLPRSLFSKEPWMRWTWKLTWQALNFPSLDWKVNSKVKFVLIGTLQPDADPVFRRLLSV